MKYLFLLLPYLALSQYHFTASDSSIIWQHSINNTITINEVLDYCQDNIRHTIAPQIRDNSIYGTTDFIEVLTDKSGIAIGAKTAARFQYRVTFIDNQYTITIRRIEFKSIEVDILGVTDTSHTSIESLSLRNKDQTMRSNKMTQRLLERLDAAFLKLFTYNAADKW